MERIEINISEGKYTHLPDLEDARKPCKCCPERYGLAISVCKISGIRNNFELIQKMIRPANVKK